MTENTCQDHGQLKEIDEFIDQLAKQGSLDGKLIAILHKAQEIVGYLPDEVQAHIARRLSMPPAKVNGVVTFYSYFSTVPRGKYVVNICMGTACFVLGADKILEEFSKQLGIEPGQTTPDHMFTLNALRCVGACGLAPLAVVNEKLYGKITIDDVKKIIEEYKEGGVGNE
ncbi:MAG: NAD(P)H-dependent oxidoreductase subunit E [Oscillospiraceae bacterium]|nr:NAD(P)H-dependent oxidoreductase subunit E [Oscillospiraceae bacterium]